MEILLTWDVKLRQVRSGDAWMLCDLQALVSKVGFDMLVRVSLIEVQRDRVRGEHDRQASKQRPGGASYMH